MLLTHTEALARVATTSVSPTSASYMASTTITVTGSGFCPGNGVQLYSNTYHSFMGNGYPATFINSTTLTATISFTEPPDSTPYTLVAVDGQGTCGGTVWPGGVPFSLFMPAPTLGTIVPSSATAGDPALTLTVYGTNFFNYYTAVNWNGSSRTTTFVNSTQITASIPASDLTTSGIATITVSSPGGTSGGLTFAINKANQTITFGALPNKLVTDPPFTVSATASSGLAVSFSATGVCTVSGSAVTLNGAAGTCTVTASQAGNATYNAAPNVSQSFSVNKLGQTITFGALSDKLRDDPAFTVSATADSGLSVIFTASGSCFVSGSTATLIGTGTCTVTASQSGNATYNAAANVSQSFMVNNPVPATTSLSPASSAPGVAGFTLTVTGSRFVQTSTVQWNGTALATTYVSAAQLTASIPASDVAIAGTATVTVVNGAPGGGTSNPQTFTITYLAPTLTSLSQPSAPMGSASTQVTVTGANFYSGASTVQWNGVALTTTYMSPTQLSATIPAANLVTPDSATVTVVTTSPGGGTSTGLPFIILPVVQVGALQQNGWNVTAGVTWPTAATVTAQTLDCGTTPAQVLSGPAVTCVYSQAGTYTLRVTSTVGGTPGVQSPTQTVTVPLLAPTQATLTPTIDGRLAVPGVDTYTLPVPLSVAVALTRPVGVGIADPLNLNASTVKVQLGAGAPLNATTTSADPLTYTASRSLSDAGTYTITLQGVTAGGAAISASTTTTLTMPTVSLQIGPLTQNNFNVDVPISWPAGAVTVNVDCGTITTQTFTGASGACTYGKSGPFSVVGRYIEPYHGATVQTTAAINIPLLVPTTATLAATVNGLQPAADGTISPFRFPASASTAITLVRPAGIGIVDPLDLNASRLAITPAGGTPSNVFVRAGADVLQTTATGQLDAAATYTLQLNGQTIGGGAVTGSLTLIVAQGSPVLILGGLVQDGFNVLMTVSWPNDLQGAVPVSIDCGTPATQFLTGTTGVCRYTTADTFQLRGSYKSPETGAPTLQTTLQPVTIPLRVPTGANLAFAVNTVAVTGSSITAYRFPAIVKSTATLTLPVQIGIIDPLDVGPSRLKIGRAGGSLTAYRLSLGTDQTLTTSLSSFDAPGDYTISLTGQTVRGTAVTATQTLTVTAANVSLILGNLVQDGANVAVSVTWPDGITPMAVSCGTSSLQTFTGPAGACSYTRPGSFQITGTFKNPEDASNFSATPATVTIPAIAPVNPQIALQVNSQPVTASASSYRLPSNLTAIITLTRPDGIGILDQLDTQNSTLSITPDGLPSTRYRPVVRDNPLSATVNGEVRRIGAYAIVFQGKTLTGQTLSASAALTIDLGKATLLADPPAQDGNAVIVRVRWPDSGPTGAINCGFMSQTLTAPSGTCRYTRAGSYQIVGFFPDPARGATVLTDPIPVVIPLLAPINASLSIASVNSAGVSADATGPVPVFTTIQPQSYPVGVRLALAFQRPDGIGILDVIDRSHSSLTAAAAADGATPIPLALSSSSGPLELTALATLRSFPPDPADPSRWRYRFTFTGHALGGSAYSAQADLAGLIGQLTPLTLQVSRAAPAAPYAPATYQYSLTSAHSATLGEPIAATWTVTADGQPPGQSVQNSRMAVTFQGPGRYQVSLAVTGPFSGTSTWSDTVTVPGLPDISAPTIVARAPDHNRPPADYRFTVTTPPMPDPRERIGVPTWTAEGTNVTGPVFVTTFTTAGEHQVGVSLPTSYGRTLEAHTTVSINPNQPPVGTVDCSRSTYRTLTKKYTLSCRATAADPDGRISSLKWVIPELQIERADIINLTLEADHPAAVTVELHITDNSSAETVVSVPIDMAQLPVQ